MAGRASVVELKDIKRELESMTKGLPKLEGTHNIFPSILRDIQKIQQKLDYLSEKVSYAEKRAAKLELEAKAATKAVEKKPEVEAG